MSASSSRLSAQAHANRLLIPSCSESPGVHRRSLSPPCHFARRIRQVSGTRWRSTLAPVSLNPIAIYRLPAPGNPCSPYGGPSSIGGRAARGTISPALPTTSGRAYRSTSSPQASRSSARSPATAAFQHRATCGGTGSIS